MSKKKFAYNYQERYFLDDNSFASDMKHFPLCYNFLYKQGVFSKKINKHLDFGAGHGHFSFLLQVLNKVKYSMSLDKRYFVNTSNLDHFSIYYKFLIKQKIRNLFRSNSLLGKFGNVDNNSIYSNLPYIPKKIPKIDFTTDDVYDIKSKFDFVTSISCLDFFNVDKIFNKVSNILNKKGIFFIFLDYWWYPANSSLVYLDKPFELQKKKYSELKKYIKSKNLDQKEIKKRFFYYHDGYDVKPTVEDYIKTAYKYNLKLQSIERHIPSEYIENRINLIPETYIGTKLKAKNKSPSNINIKELNKIIKDIKKIKKNIQIEDLFTHFTCLLFEKK